MTDINLKQLRTLAENDGKWNWHKFSRFWASHHDISEIDLGVLIDRNLIEEIKVDGEPLPRLKVTEAGFQLLHEKSGSS